MAYMLLLYEESAIKVHKIGDRGKKFPYFKMRLLFELKKMSADTDKF